MSRHKRNKNRTRDQGTAAGGAATPLRVIQLTDPHLFAESAGRLLGLTTRLSFESVLAMAMECSTPADALVMTGDLVHDGSTEGYHYLRQMLESVGIPFFCIPGNHDRPERIARVIDPLVAGGIAVRRLANWDLIFMDSTVTGTDSGRIGAAQLDALEQILVDASGPSILFLHQHPLPAGSAWMDTMGVENGAELLALCARHPTIAALVCGHIHQEIDRRHAGVRVLGTPSTCIQFLPGSEEFALDALPPGYRELLLLPDGGVETRVIRLADYPEPFETEAGGY